VVELNTARETGAATRAPAQFARDGFCVLRLPDPRPVASIRAKLRELVVAITGERDAELETVHRYLEDDAMHLRVQQAATERLRQERWHVDVLAANLPAFIEVLGPDIDVQRSPYLRLARPGRPADNVGFHRDTVYGGSSYEVSVFIPFVDVGAGATLQVEPGSHGKSDAEIPFRRTEDPSVVKGSARHQLGYPYAPQVLDAGYRAALQPVPLMCGEVLLFTLALLHGSVVNASETTRWSSDVRLKNAFAPVGARASAEIYMPMCRSAVTQAAEAYLHANAAEARA
jgi:ectoine hydroxylase-related dioxygenase (phytanoyl-CoA dioxygenase family)